MIPKIIHQMNGELTDTVRESQKSIKDTHPDWEYRFWIDKDIEKLIKIHFPQYYTYWAAFSKTSIKKWDIARYLIIHKHGGMYVDVDTIFYKNMNKVLDLNKSLIFVHKMGKKRWIKNHFFLSRPVDPFWLYSMNKIVNIHSSTGVHDHTGGKMLHRYICSYNKNIKNREDIQYLNPNFVSNTNLKYEGRHIKDFKQEDVYVEHLVSATWRNLKNKNEN